MRKTVLLFSAAAAVIAPAVVTAQVAGRPLNPRYVAQSQKEHPELVAELGGAETGARAAYVDTVGRRVAAYSGVMPGAYRFTLLNSAVENAFATPGGYVYVTRQLMALLDNESELAFALGHEVGHVAANHAQQRQSAARRNSILGVLGAILGSMGGGAFGNILSQSAQQAAEMATLRFSREQEYQADTLGLRYIVNAGYDPAGGPGILNRDQYLAQLEGVYVDDDPAQGIIEGRTFTHPDLRIFFAVPPGYLMQNSTDAVGVKGSGGQAQFSGGRFTGPIEDYIGRVLQSVAGQTPLALAPIQRTSVNGLPAAFTTARAQTSSGVVDLSVFAYQWDANTVYHFVMLTQGGAGIGPFVPMVQSIRRISAAEASAIRPRIIDVVTVGPRDTVQSLASRMAYRNFQVERFLSLNGLTAASRLTPGTKVKLVVYGTRRT